jgi:HlyD family secretion protein
MDDSNRIFRQAALDRLSSPEQLDQLMQVTTPKSWLAQVACSVLVMIALAWGIWGSIQINVYGRGLLTVRSGVFVATAFGDGRVAEILVHEAQPVDNQQLLARLRVPELELKINQAVTNQSRLQREMEQLTSYLRTESTNEIAYQEAEVSTYLVISNDCLKQIAALKERFDALEELSLGKGEISNAVTRPQLLNAKIDLFAARHELELTGIHIKDVLLRRMQAEERRHQTLLDKQALIDQGNFNLEALTNLYKLTAEIRSPFVGKVLEITVKTNQLVGANKPIMTLQSTQEKLEALLFLAPGDGKRVAPYMDVRISPVSVKKEVSGMMLGRVVGVSALPATPESMLKVLENPTLVNEFSQNGAPIRVEVELQTNFGEYKWTSKPPMIRMTSGTLCEGTITLKNRSPFSLVLPLLRYGTDL